MNPDVVNGLFELVGSILIWMNVSRVVKDRGYAGVFPPAVAFFAAWGLWNLYYYPALGQWWSFAGGCSIVLANSAWVALLLSYGRKKTFRKKTPSEWRATGDKSLCDHPSRYEYEPAETVGDGSDYRSKCLHCGAILRQEPNL